MLAGQTTRLAGCAILDEQVAARDVSLCAACEAWGLVSVRIEADG